MIYLRLFWAFFKIGLLGFGGGNAIIKLISDSIQEFVAMTPTEFANIVAIAQVTPGPVAINTATYIGYEAAGFWGSAIATLGVVTPAFILISLVCKFMNQHRDNTIIDSALKGIRPATVGMVASAAITISLPAFIADDKLGTNISALSGLMTGKFDFIAIAIAAVTIYLIGKKKVNAFKVLIVMGVIGAILGA